MLDKEKTYKEKIYLEKEKFKVKFLFFITIIFIIAVILLFLRIQIVKYDKYSNLSQKNILKKSKLIPPRGLIKDRKGKILADNRLSFDIIIPKENYMGKNKAKTLKEIEYLEKICSFSLKKEEDFKYFGTHYLAAEDIPFKVANIFLSNKSNFKNISIRVNPRRLYPHKKTGSPILGHIGEATSSDIEKFNIPRGYFVGKYGIERSYEKILQGTSGERFQIVNSLGILQRVLKDAPPKRGATLNLTINIDMQKQIEKLMLEGNWTGSVIVMNPNNGEIYSLISTPLFDPNKFTSRFPKKEWAKIINQEGKPLINKTISGLYSLGSIFKLVTALAGLEENIINEHKTVYCYGYREIYNQIFDCWKEHGKVNLFSAIQQSCDVYFYLLGKSLTIDLIEQYAKKLKLGRKTGIDLFGEKQGLVPSREWKKNTSNTRWFPGETISVAIGQGPLLVTPIQIAQLTSIIANRGTLVKPHLLKSYNKDKKLLIKNYIKTKIKIKKENFEKIIKGMWLVVNTEEGTGDMAQIKGMDVCGKTSTVQVISKDTLKRRVKDKEAKKWKNHAWFTCFAPRESPEVVVVVILEHGGEGGLSAALLAKKVLNIFFKMKNEKIL